jgi:hypothetical protein
MTGRTQVADGRLNGPDARARASTVLTVVDLITGTVDERIARAELAIGRIDAVAKRVDDEIDRLSVLRMKESLRLLAGPPADGVDNGPLLGLAAWDGTLVLDEDLITKPLEEMYAAPGARHDIATLRRYRFALSELFHQQSHFLAGDGASYADSAGVFADPVVRLLELGVTASWTARHLDDYLVELGVPEVAPGIEQVSLPVGYPAYVPAVEALVIGVAARAGMPPDDVLRRLNGVTPAAKWNEITTLLLVASGLASVVPPADRPAVATQVREAMQMPLFVMATLDTVGATEPAIQATSAEAGRDAIAAGVTQIDTIRHEFSGT